MNQKSLVYKVAKGLLKRLLFVNIIGFIIGAVISGSNVISYWMQYVIYSSVIGLTLWIGNESFSKYVDNKYSWLEFPIRKLVIRLVFSLVYGSFVMVILYMFIWFIINKNKDFTNFYDFNRFSFLIFYACTLIVMLVIHSIAFFKSWQTAAFNEERLKKESASFQLQALRNQVDPHFLFNSLNTLTSLIERDQKLAITFVKQLSDMFRYMLGNDKKELIDIHSELKFVEAYVYLQQIRFGENLKVEMGLKNTNFYVLPISLQMLVENAIKHNEISADFPLMIKINEEKDYVIVENNIQPKILEATSNGIGLQNLKVRYSFFTSKDVLIESLAERFIVKIPKLSI